MKIEDIAKVCHEAIRAYRENLGDYSGVPWEVTPEAQRESMMLMVELFDSGFSIGDVHVKWSSWMLSRGWRYGPRVDPALKMDNNLLPWTELPESHKNKLRITLYISGVLKEE